MTGPEQHAATVRENVSHIARGCRAGTSHNPAVYEQAIDAALGDLVAQADRAAELEAFVQGVHDDADDMRLRLAARRVLAGDGDDSADIGSSGDLDADLDALGFDPFGDGGGA